MNNKMSDKSKQRSRSIYLLPNLFTVAALFSGFYAIVAALKGFFDSAAIAIFIAMLLDSLDGRVARMTKTMSPFGAQFDSLSDMVDFGLAPAILAYSWSLYTLGKLGWLAAFVYVVAVALRLARFNIQVETADKRYFQGLACTPAAGVLAGLVWAVNGGISLLGMSGMVVGIGTALITVMLAVFMVSNIKYRSFKEIDPHKHVSFMVIVCIVLALVFISIDPPRVLFGIFSIYALYGPAEFILNLRK